MSETGVPTVLGGDRAALPRHTARSPFVFRPERGTRPRRFVDSEVQCSSASRFAGESVR
jgi:hypothetical protein